MDLREYKVVNSRLASYIPWFGLVGPGIVLNTDGSFMKTFGYRGHDLESSTDYEELNLHAAANNILKRFGAGWAVYVEAQRRRAADYPVRAFPDPLTQLIDLERRAYFADGRHYESEYYLTIQWLPPGDKAGKAAGIFYENEDVGAERADACARDALSSFKAAAGRFYAALSEITKECRPLTDEETITYLHSCVSLSRQKVEVPVTPAFLAELLCDTPLSGGLEPALGRLLEREYLALVSIYSFPPDSCPGILDALNRLDIDYRWCSRFIFLDKADAEGIIRKLRREWFSGHKSLITMIKETITKSESAMLETLNIERSHDAEAALNELGNDYVRFGYLTSVVVLKDKDRKALGAKVRKVVQAYTGRGFTVSREDINAVGAFLGSIPGQAYANVRRPLVSTLNLVHLLPLSAVWAGDAVCRHLDASALMQVETEGSTPFRLNIHVGDVGHTMVVGPTGAGKSVFLNFLEAQCRGIKHSRIFVFDKGGSSRVLAYGTGGAFYELAGEAGENAQSFQPLRYIDEENERIWASEWLQEIFSQEGVKMTPAKKEALWQALVSLASAPADERTLFGFANLVQDLELRAAIAPFVSKVEGVTEGGPYGRLFDADSDTLKLGSYQSFEMGELMDKKSAVLPALLYLFHVIEKSADGRAVFIVLDECWTFLDNPVFAGKIREWLKTMRKNNVSIIFATQNLSDIKNSGIASAIIESCMTRIFLPNVNAQNPADSDVYRYFGLNDTEREIIARAMPKRQYYYKSPLGSRLFELALSPFALSFLAAGTKEEQAEALRIKKEHPADDFCERWLSFKGEEDALEVYTALKAGKLKADKAINMPHS